MERAAALLFGAIVQKMASASGVGACAPARQQACEKALLDCKLSVPVADTMGICACAAIYYGACLPTAGCAAAEQMMSCVEELMQLDCQDMSVCGNDCTVEDGDPLVPADSIVVPVNNFGANYLQLSVCSKGVNAAKLDRFGQISMERCTEEDFRVCDLAVAPRTLTAVAFHPDVTYLRVEQCILVAAGSVSIGEQGEAEELWECLKEPLPAEYYGAAVNYGGGLGSGSGDTETGGSALLLSHWPSSVDVDFSVAPLCEQDSHCPGSYCSSQQQPRICAPKMGEHFQESGEHFLDPRWEILA